MEAVSIVTIKSINKLYKGEQEASNIELIELEELGYDLVAGKGLYNIGDKAVFIMPDFNLSDIPLFEGFLRPGGDISKSMLGKVEGIPVRIRAKKFNFSREGSIDPVYSNGILLPYDSVWEYLYSQGCQPIDLGSFDLTKELCITKWEEPEVRDKAGNKVGGARVFPEGLYKTDETNINNLWGHIENKIGYPITLVGTEKVDGSSITIGVKNGKGFICSRNQQLDLIVKKHNGRREKTFLEKILFWIKPDLNLYKEVENDSDFVKYGKPYLDELIGCGEDNLVLRGELHGKTLKGSGNKVNPASKVENNIKFFGLDFIENGIAQKATYNNIKEFQLTYPEFRFVKEVFNKEFNSRQEIEYECNNYFKNNLTEGIVIRTEDSKFSGKFMNLEYDSRK